MHEEASKLHAANTPGTGAKWVLVACAIGLATVAGSCGGDATPTAPAITIAATPPTAPPPPPSLAPVGAPVPPRVPTALATPAFCPPLTVWTSKIHNMYKDSRQTMTPVPGGYVLIDSTPHFGGVACNVESDGCGGRQCEDPRGGDWTLLAGDSPTNALGYQFKIGPLEQGFHRWRVCPKSDAHDAEGFLLTIGADPCSEGTFTVQ